VNELELQTEVPVTHEVNSIESSLKGLWDKIQSAVELINRLRQENATLSEQNEKLSVELRRTTAQFENQLSSLHSQYDRELNSMKSQLETEKTSLKKFYDTELTKVRSSAEAELQATRTMWETTVREVREKLEGELNSTRNQLSLREQDLKRLKAEYSQLVNANENVAFTKEEKEILRNRIRDLIAKINSHL